MGIQNKLPIIALLFFFVASSFSQNTVKVVCIDAGHGGKDPGVVQNRIKEKDLTLEIAKILGQKIKQKHLQVKVYYTRLTDNYKSLRERADIANRNKADLFISIHINSNTKTQPNGTMSIVWGENKKGRRIYDISDTYLEETILLENAEAEEEHKGTYYETFTAVASPASFEIAGLIETKLKTKTTLNSYGVKRGDFFVIKYTKMPAVLIEAGFLSNSKDRNYVNSKKGQTAIAEATYFAFLEYKTGNKNGFYIQLSASRTRPDYSFYKGLTNVQIKQKNGWYKCVMTGFSTKAEAVKQCNS